MATPPQFDPGVAARIWRETSILEAKRKRMAEDAALARQSFRHFVPLLWPVAMPSAPFIRGAWHIDAIADHLEALGAEKNGIQNLLIVVPPGSAKSTLASVLYPAWRWLSNPRWRSIWASYDETLVSRDSVACRDVIRSQLYQDLFKPPWKLKADQNEKTYFYTTERGFRMTTTVEGKGTGHRANLLGVDDALSTGARYSQTTLGACIRWYNTVWFNRLLSMEDDSRVVIGQRVADNDLIGHLLKEHSDWEILIIPMEYDPRRSRVTSIGWKDPRTEKGQLMFEAKFPRHIVEGLKRDQDTWCTPGHTPILMSDWTEKKIRDIEIGDVVIGFKLAAEFKNPRSKQVQLAPSTVLKISRSVQPVFRFRLRSGRIVECTKDHKWYRVTKRLYRPIKIGSTLCSVYTPPKPVASSEEQRLYDWLGGILDGEGSCEHRGAVSISQSSRNPDVVAGIFDTLAKLGFTAHVTQGRRTKKDGSFHANWAPITFWQISGGRSTKVRILANCKMFKRQRFIESLWKSISNLGENVKTPGIHGYGEDHRVESIECIGTSTVYGLTTTTGNYVAWGFASQNSTQYQGEPTIEGGSVLKSHMWRYWQPPGMGLPPVRVLMPDGNIEERQAVDLPDSFDLQLQSWDLSVKDLETSDNAAGCVIGTRGADRFIQDMRVGKMDLPKAIQAIREMSRFYPKAHLKLIEDKANGPAAIQMLSHEVPGMVPVNPQGGKLVRAKAAAIELESGNWYLPHPLLADWVGNPEYPKKNGFIAETSLFPFGEHDDQCDAFSQAAIRIQQENIGGVFGVSDKDIRIEQVEIGASWPRLCGLAINWQEFAAVWLARKPETGEHYLYAEYRQDVGDPAQHAAEVLKRGDWIHSVIHPMERNRPEVDGYRLIGKYREMRLKIDSIPGGIEGEIPAVTEAFSSGKLKVCANLQQFFDQFRMFRRTEKGVLSGHAVGLMKAVCVVWAARDRAKGPPQAAKRPDVIRQFSPGGTGGNGSWMGNL